MARAIFGWNNDAFVAKYKPKLFRPDWEKGNFWGRLHAAEIGYTGHTGVKVTGGSKLFAE